MPELENDPARKRATAPSEKAASPSELQGPARPADEVLRGFIPNGKERNRSDHAVRAELRRIDPTEDRSLARVLEIGRAQLGKGESGLHFIAQSLDDPRIKVKAKLG